MPHIKKKYESCLDIYEGRVVSLRGPFEAGMHDMTVFRGGKEEDGKENWDREALYFKIKKGDCIVGDSGYEGEPSKIVVMRDEHSKKFKKFLASLQPPGDIFQRAQRLENSQESFCLWQQHSRKDEITQDGC